MGFIETRGLVAAIEAADAMLKAAQVKLVKMRRVGGALVTVIIQGDLGACQAAVRAGSQAASRVGELISAHVIARPYADTQDQISTATAPAPVVQPVAGKPAPVRKRPPKPASAQDTPAAVLAMIRAAKKGLSLNELSAKITAGSAELRQILKDLMDQGKIEKVQKRYFFIPPGE